MSEIIKAVEAAKNENVPDLQAGDNVSVFVRIKEGTTVRTQEFKGTIIRQHRGGNDANFTVRRVASNGIGVERLPARSPMIEKVIVHRHSHVRRSAFISCAIAQARAPG
jgi:large subunit ribosomal protein L19